jgi:hypothetical protein
MRAYQGMCFTTPKRISSAATKAASTAQVSQENFVVEDFSDFLLSAAFEVVISFRQFFLGDGFRLPRRF